MTPEDFGHLTAPEADRFIDDAYANVLSNFPEQRKLGEADLRVVSEYFMRVTEAYGKQPA